MFDLADIELLSSAAFVALFVFAQHFCIWKSAYQHLPDENIFIKRVNRHFVAIFYFVLLLFSLIISSQN